MGIKREKRPRPWDTEGTVGRGRKGQVRQTLSTPKLQYRSPHGSYPVECTSAEHDTDAPRIYDQSLAARLPFTSWPIAAVICCGNSGVLRMSNAERLRFLAEKCDELARTARNDNIRDRHLDLAASYRRLADREQFLEASEQTG